jgi:hypothetical protein
MPQRRSERPPDSRVRRRRIAELEQKLQATADKKLRERLEAQINFFEFRADPPRLPRN